MSVESKEQHFVETSGTIIGDASPTLRIYAGNANVHYAVDSREGERAIDITIEQLTQSELSSMEELDVGRTKRGNFGDPVVRKTPKSGVRITTKVRTETGNGEYGDTKFVTADLKGEYTAVDVNGTKKRGDLTIGGTYKGGDATTVDYIVLSKKINAEDSWGRKTALRIRIEPLTQKELWENRDIDLSLTDRAGNFGREVSRKMAECGIRMMITDGKYAEMKIVKYF